VQVQTFTYTMRAGAHRLPGLFGSGKTMDDHVAEMMSDGWEPMNSAADAGHVRVGKTLAGMALTGGLSLFFGASRTAEKITLTFKRS
jgi:hypothetical protein